jgi:hypothetical protein
MEHTWGTAEKGFASNKTAKSAVGWVCIGGKSLRAEVDASWNRRFGLYRVSFG